MLRRCECGNVHHCPTYKAIGFFVGTGYRPKDSYVQLAFEELSRGGKPMTIAKLVEKIRIRRDNPLITRAAVETSLLRHSHGKAPSIFKVAAGVYGLTRTPQSDSSPAH